MKRACCLKCGSFRLHVSRRRSWLEYAAALSGWRMRRCQDCNTRFLQCGNLLVSTNHLKRIQHRILLGAAVIGALGAVLAAILYFGHMETAAAAEGIFLALSESDRGACGAACLFGGDAVGSGSLGIERRGSGRVSAGRLHGLRQSRFALQRELRSFPRSFVHGPRRDSRPIGPLCPPQPSTPASYWLRRGVLRLSRRARRSRARCLSYALGIGTAICIAGTIQLFTSRGDVFWLFPSGYDTRVIGPFVSPNNYAAFVELLVPIALTRRGAWRLPVAAALAATVAASGSRAGAVLVAVEIVAVLALQRKARDFALFAALAAVCVAIVGPQFLWDRLGQTDPFAVRREFLESTVAMFRAQPLHGFGLGAWRFAYLQFALIDTGQLANHAHNEWAQWAAEGGVPGAGGGDARIARLACAARIAQRVGHRADRRAAACRGGLSVPAPGPGRVDLHTRGRPQRRSGMDVAASEVSRLRAAALRGLRRRAIRLRRCAIRACNACERCTGRADFQSRGIPFRAGATRSAAHRAAPASGVGRQPLRHDIAHRAGSRARIRGQCYRSGASVARSRASRPPVCAPAWELANFYFRRNSTAFFWTWARRAAAMCPSATGGPCSTSAFRLRPTRPPSSPASATRNWKSRSCAI